MRDRYSATRARSALANLDRERYSHVCGREITAAEQSTGLVPCAHSAPMTAFVETRTPMAQPTQPQPLQPASEKLLREIAKYDTGAGVQFQHAARARYTHPNTLSTYNARTFYPLMSRGLLADDGNDSAPVRITEAGRRLLAHLDAAAKPKRKKKPPNPESPAALKLLRTLAEHTEPVLIHSGQPRTIWHLGSPDGFSARDNTYFAVATAGYAEITYSFAGGRRIAITDTGRQRANGKPNAFPNGVCPYGEDQERGAGCILPAGHTPANRHVVTPGDSGDD